MKFQWNATWRQGFWILGKRWRLLIGRRGDLSAMPLGFLFIWHPPERDGWDIGFWFYNLHQWGRA